MVINSTSTVEMVIQAVSPLLGTGTGAAAGAAGVAAAGAATAGVASAGFAASAGLAASTVAATAAGAAAVEAGAACAIAKLLASHRPKPRLRGRRYFFIV
jgi:hypothetical protein